TEAGCVRHRHTNLGVFTAPPRWPPTTIVLGTYRYAREHKWLQFLLCNALKATLLTQVDKRIEEPVGRDKNKIFNTYNGMTSIHEKNAFKSRSLMPSWIRTSTPARLKTTGSY
ncbi:MAG TPA: hypothetical protein VIG85_09925, partial [Comamonas sp.]